MALFAPTTNQKTTSLVKPKLQLADEETKAKIATKRKKSPEDENIPYLTDKPVIYMFNVDEEGLTDITLHKKLGELIGNTSTGDAPGGGPPLSDSEVGEEKARQDPSRENVIFVNAKLEEEMSGMSRDERKEFLKSYGVEHDALEELIKAAYETLGLQSFLTAGQKECRAWTIKKGSTAPEAAGTIHTDFERGFIAAEVCKYDDLVRLGSEKAVKEAGLLRTEGKSYVMQDGDVVEFKFNV